MPDFPNYSAEKEILAQGYKTICGVDEVGRGPWAGPVVAAAVVLDETQLPLGVTDSKKLSAKRREALYDFIMEQASVGNTQVFIAEASVEEIDSLNIREATLLAMKRAVEGLNAPVDYVFVDGNVMPNLSCKGECVVKGDSRVMSIAAASVVAKVYRDRLMGELANAHPHYGWEKNAGYGVKVHQEGIAAFGVTEHHRRSFKPIRTYLEAQR